jgi:hypothetical protein
VGGRWLPAESDDLRPSLNEAAQLIDSFVY